MDRCTEYCTREATGDCALCEALAERERFVYLWLKGGVLWGSVRAMRRDFSRAPEARQALVWRYLVTVWHHGRCETLEEFLAPTFVHHTRSLLDDSSHAVHGLDGVRREVTAWRTGFPDLRWTFDDLKVMDDTVVARWTGQGTHQGMFRSLAPTGQRVTWTGISLYRIAQGKIAEQWTAEDGLGLYRQLGLLRA